MNKRKVLNSLISIGSYREFVAEIFNLVEREISSYVCFANVHMVIEAYKDKGFQEIINNAAIVAPDGKPISLFLQYLYALKQDRVCGMDVFPTLLQEAEARGKSVYLYGDTAELLDLIVQKANKEFPDLKICGYYSPPFRDLSDEETHCIIENINTALPDLVFVALGCPKQEKWMAKNVNKLESCLLGVGQAFKVYAGVEKRLPVWMRNLSLEWMYRLYLEPRRLGKRYLITNSYFLWLASACAFKRIRHKFFPSFSNSKLS